MEQTLLCPRDYYALLKTTFFNHLVNRPPVISLQFFGLWMSQVMQPSPFVRLEQAHWKGFDILFSHKDVEGSDYGNIPIPKLGGLPSSTSKGLRFIRLNLIEVTTGRTFTTLG
ncbi:hypothetical protein ILYODFUR_027715 [Ilyodon furcidens]|uniref:Uncharacterized protein n=1 Tax=Ilyodon furcidens TaxID=33524 RepID=A0ABV0UJI9_9TELE